MKAKYKVGDKVQFTFAGCPEVGTIIEVEKSKTSISYIIQDIKYKYPTTQSEIQKKL